MDKRDGELFDDQGAEAKTASPRVSAGAASLRWWSSLEEHLERARARAQELKGQLASDPGQDRRRTHAARERARWEREPRVAVALARMLELEAIKRQQGKKGEDAWASSTAGDTTVMKMGDGGFRPAYNAQFATDCESQVIVGVAVRSTWARRRTQATRCTSRSTSAGCWQTGRA